MLGGGLALAGCTDQPVRNTEQLLRDSGFEAHVPATPLEEEALNALPPNVIVARVQDGRVGYYYADPKLCGCVYVGNQVMFDAFSHTSAAYARADASMTAGRMQQQ
jgi:hypothetical protein